MEEFRSSKGGSKRIVGFRTSLYRLGGVWLQRERDNQKVVETKQVCLHLNSE